MRWIVLAAAAALAACESDPYYDDLMDPFESQRSDWAFDSRMCSYRYDDIEAGAASLQEAIDARDAVNCSPRLETLRSRCDEFYSGFLTRSSSCPEALRKMGDQAIAAQFIARTEEVCAIARGLPVTMG